MTIRIPKVNHVRILQRSYKKFMTSQGNDYETPKHLLVKFFKAQKEFHHTIVRLLNKHAGEYIDLQRRILQLDKNIDWGLNQLETSSDKKTNLKTAYALYLSLQQTNHQLIEFINDQNDLNKHLRYMRLLRTYSGHTRVRKDWSDRTIPVYTQKVGNCDVCTLTNVISFELSGNKGHKRWTSNHKASIDYIWYMASVGKNGYAENIKTVKRKSVPLVQTSVIEYGAVLEKDWPSVPLSDTSSPLKRPPQRIVNKGLKNIFIEVELPIHDPMSWVKYLDKGHLLYFVGQLQNNTFQYFANTQKTYVPANIVDPVYDKDKSFSWHAMTIVGYDTGYPSLHQENHPHSKPVLAFKIQNSWGEHRHDKGFFWITYKELVDFTPITPRAFLHKQKTIQHLAKQHITDYKKVRHETDYIMRNNVSELSYLHKERNIIQKMRHQIRDLIRSTAKLKNGFNNRQCLIKPALSNAKRWQSNIRKLNRYMNRMNRLIYRNIRAEKYIEEFLNANREQRLKIEGVDAQKLQELVIYTKKEAKMVLTESNHMTDKDTKFLSTKLERFNTSWVDLDGLQLKKMSSNTTEINDFIANLKLLERKAKVYEVEIENISKICMYIHSILK